MSTFNGWNVVTMPGYPAPATITFTAQDIVAAVRSPFTGQAQIQNWQSSWLEAQVQMPPMTDAHARQWHAWLMSTQGIAGCFMLGDPLCALPLGTGSGAITVSGANQSGYTLNVIGGIGAGCLLAGDYIQIGQRLYRLMSQYDGGSATLQIWPQIREIPASGAAVAVKNTQGMFRLKTNDRRWSYTRERLTSIQFDCWEAI